MSAPVALPDPFALTADPDGYLPRPATEQALAALVATLREGKRPAALLGPPGLGKTLLLHLVARRLNDRLRSVYLPYAALPLDELCAWSLSLLGFSQSSDTIGDLIQTASELLSRGSGLLLLIDDAGAMPLPTARKLGDLVAASSGALRLLTAAAEGPSASRMLAATGANVHVVPLVDPMSEEETREYVLARLARARIPAPITARFDAATLRRVHRLSAGIPRRVHSVASAVLRGGAPESGADPAEEREEAPSISINLAPELEGAEASEGEIPPVYQALAWASTPRAEARVETAPSARAVFATALLFGALGVSVSGVRALLGPPPASVAAPRAAPAAPARAEAPAAVIEPARSAAPTATAASQTVSVQVNARPWANIEVDGVDLGPTPIAGIPLLAGPHRFRAHMPDGRVVERDVTVTAENRFIVFE
ncbi:MAG TPA: AAA family ATPase [Myxococcota bacterium]